MMLQYDYNDFFFDFATQIHATKEDVEYVIEVMERKGTIVCTPRGFILLWESFHTMTSTF